MQIAVQFALKLGSFATAENRFCVSESEISFLKNAPHDNDVLGTKERVPP